MKKLIKNKLVAGCYIILKSTQFFLYLLLVINIYCKDKLNLNTYPQIICFSTAYMHNFYLI